MPHSGRGPACKKYEWRSPTCKFFSKFRATYGVWRRFTKKMAGGDDRLASFPLQDSRPSLYMSVMLSPSPYRGPARLLFPASSSNVPQPLKTCKASVERYRSKPVPSDAQSHLSLFTPTRPVLAPLDVNIPNNVASTKRGGKRVAGQKMSKEESKVCRLSDTFLMFFTETCRTQID